MKNGRSTIARIGLFVLAIDTVYSANILGIFTFPGTSNFHFNKAILESLHEAGHQITFLTTFASKAISSPNFTVIDVSGGLPNLVGGFSPITFASFTVRERMQYLFAHEERYCAEIMKTPIIRETLRSKLNKFDVIMTQIMFVPHCQLKIAEVLQIPIIGTVGFKKEMPTLDIGNPLNPSFLAHVLSAFSERMSFTERLLNTWYYVAARYLDDTSIQPRVTKLCQKHFPESPAPPKISPSLIFVNSHSSLLPRPLVPNFIEVAGIHIRPPKPLTQTMRKFVEDAKNGVILFTFGSVISPSQLPADVVTAFVEAFASIPQRVIWKYDQPLENVSDNVMLVDWLPQRDLLEHENIIAFISHCGLSGMLEAIDTATPIVAVPIFADQPSNALFLQESNVAVPLSPFTATKKQILDALDTIVNDTRYSENMQKLSERFKDRLRTPEESIVYWTEYVIKHGGAAHLRTIAADMPFYQYLLLDVILFVCTALAIVLYAIYFFITRTSRLKTKSSTEILKKKE